MCDGCTANGSFSFCPDECPVQEYPNDKIPLQDFLYCSSCKTEKDSEGDCMMYCQEEWPEGN